MEFFEAGEAIRLTNPGIASEQLLSPHNSESKRVTITRVTVEPGASQPRHKHNNAEQIWIALAGTGELLLANKATRSFAAGATVRFAEGDVHGVENRTSEPFVYMAVTSPPINFDYAYSSRK